MMTRSEELMAREEGLEVEGTVVILGTRGERVLPGKFNEDGDRFCDHDSACSILMVRSVSIISRQGYTDCQ
jgi:hypothetical protein